MKNVAIIMAAGLGKRMGGANPKQYLEVAGKPIIARALAAYDTHPEIDGIIIVVEKERVADIKNDFLKKWPVKKLVAVVAGGKERQDSVWNGIKGLPMGTEIVLIHDAVRPFITADIISKNIADVKRHGAAIVAVPVKDTIKDTRDGLIRDTVDRSRLWAAQTPQSFKYELIETAYDQAMGEKFYTTDDAAVVEHYGHKVAVTMGSYLNIKITTPEDMVFAEAVIASTTKRSSGINGIASSRTPRNDKRGVGMRTGIGYDIHRLVAGRKLILGGVEIKHTMGLDGHSDADVLIHAIMDALLGAAGLADIGTYFPNTDVKYKGISSIKLLEHVVALLKEKNFKIGNIDSMMIAEEPKLASHIAKMKENIARACGVDVGAIGIKATTNETVGAVGRSEAIAAQAVATIKIGTM